MAFAQQWAADWNRLAIDTIVDHFAPEGEMRSPLATKFTGSSIIKGRDAIRTYWHTAYGGLTEPRLTLESTAWDGELQRLTVWWSAPLPSGPTRACEMMDFDADHQIVRSEAYYGAGS
ncbi:nuclear transport factor 2 family protein [Tardiphaga sp. 813_E8_N1_3]|uniref:nuclear transport factor 2 family protein n=1 Tax=Tardiphaga sp. 813_E8_N1_3 TaxID=3240760 RepID=UPI003F255757